MTDIWMAGPPDNTFSWFASTEDRDRRYQEWVDAGGTLRDGQCCWVKDDGLQRYRDGSWWAV